MAHTILETIRASAKKHYVYVLSRPDGTPFYVGMGKGERVMKHERDAKQPSAKGHRLSVIRKIWRDGGEVVKAIDSWHDTIESAGEREAELILQIGRRDIGTGPLTNKSSGGECPRWGPESRKLNGANKKKFFENPAARQRMSDVMTQRWRSDPDAIIRSIMAGKGTEQHKAKRRALTERMRRKFRDPNVCRKVSEMTKRWLEEHPDLAAEFQRRSAEAMRSEAGRKIVSEAQKRRFQNKDEVRKNSERVKRWYQDNAELASGYKAQRAEAARQRKEARGRVLVLMATWPAPIEMPDGRASLAVWLDLEVRIKSSKDAEAINATDGTS